MTYDEALQVSAALRKAKLPHVIAVGYHQGMNPEEQANTTVVPQLSMRPEQIEAAQAVASAIGRRLAFISDRFEFVP